MAEWFRRRICFIYFYYFSVTRWLLNWNNPKHIYKKRFFPNLVKFSQYFFRKIFLNVVEEFFNKSFCLFISCRPSFEQTSIGPTQGRLISSLHFTCKFQYFERNFTAFLPLIILGSQCQVWLKLVKVDDRQRLKKRSEKISWALSSNELKMKIYSPQLFIYWNFIVDRHI